MGNLNGTLTEDGWVDKQLEAFAEWRRPRPVTGSALLLVAALLIGYIPIHFTSELMFIGGSFTIVGLLFAVLLGFCGLAALRWPHLSTMFGVLGIALSTLSLIGALGGFLIGMVLGTAGGILCYAWEVPGDYLDRIDPRYTSFMWHGDSIAAIDNPSFSWQRGDDGNEDEEDGTDPMIGDLEEATDEFSWR